MQSLPESPSGGFANVAKLLTQPRYALLSKSKLKVALKKDGISFDAGELDRYHGEGAVNQRFARVQFERKKAFQITSPLHWFQVDVAFFNKYPEENDGIKSFIVFENVLSRKAYAYPLRSGTTSSILTEYKRFLKDAKTVKGVIGDEQFGAQGFLKYNVERGIEVYHDVARDDHITGGDKLGEVDSLCKTLKRLMLKYIAHTDDLRWIEWLPTVIGIYNSSPHSSLGQMSPDDVDKNETYQLAMHIKSTAHNTRQLRKSKIEPGMRVRVVEPRSTFAKDGPRFSKEIFTTFELDGFRWKVKNAEGRVQRRRFKAQELLPIGEVREAKDTPLERAAEKKTSHANKLQRSGLYSNTDAARQAIDAPVVVSKRVRKVPHRYT